MNEKRQKDQRPLTRINESYRGMGRKGQMKLRLAGLVMLTFGTLMPMVAGLFIELEYFYWIFSAGIVLVGLSLSWPELGLAIFELVIGAIPKGLTRALPEVIFRKGKPTDDSTTDLREK